MANPVSASILILPVVMVCAGIALAQDFHLDAPPEPPAAVQAGAPASGPSSPLAAAPGPEASLPLDEALAAVKPSPSPLLTLADRARAKAAFGAADAGRWGIARREAKRIADPLPATIIDWLMMREPGSKPGFDAIAQFAAAHSDWPDLDVLARRAEEQMIAGAVAHERVLKWFADREPITGEGMIRLGEALFAAKNDEHGVDWIRRGWIEGNFPVGFERLVTHRHGRHLRPEDHIERLDRLLWHHQTAAARRMLPHVEAGQRSLAEARIGIYTRRADSAQLLTRVPPNLADDAGLNYERARLRRKRGNHDGLEEILLDPPDDLGRAGKWWFERQFSARQALADGRAAEAYKLAVNHGPIEGADLAEAQWLSGWIALRFLGDHAGALKHFEQLYNSVRFPGSQARGAYWAGRALEASGDQVRAIAFYEAAAKHPYTFHGQLAFAKLDRRVSLPLPSPPLVSASEALAFENQDLVRAVRMLDELKETETLRRFVLQLHQLADSPGQHLLVAALADGLGYPNLAVAVAQNSANAGIPLVRYQFPIIEQLSGKLGADPALVLGVARQESRFNQWAVSSAGARGLMQLMPKTARSVAKRMREPFQAQRLLRDPDYNIRLGVQLLRELTSRWNGNYPLLLAAYNAGDARVRQWIKRSGDPRLADVDVVDWIEMIPIPETRYYIQQVLEGVQVYRELLDGGGKTELRLELDLRGNGPGRS